MPAANLQTGSACRPDARMRGWGQRAGTQGIERQTHPLNAEPRNWFVKRGGSARQQASNFIGPHPRSSPSTRLRDGPAFFTALFTLAFDRPSSFTS